MQVNLVNYRYINVHPKSSPTHEESRRVTCFKAASFFALWALLAFSARANASLSLLGTSGICKRMQHTNYKCNQNTQEVKNECFLISIKQNNVPLKATSGQTDRKHEKEKKLSWMSLWRSQLKGSLPCKDQENSLAVISVLAFLITNVVIPSVRY